MPGESRTIVARYDSIADIGHLKLAIAGWNVSVAAGASDFTVSLARGHGGLVTNPALAGSPFGVVLVTNTT
jgi:hypothetical protein